MITIPDRLEHAVRNSQHQDVLDGLLAEVMIDPIELTLFDQPQQVVIQRLRRRKVRSERLLDHQSPPCFFLLLEQADVRGRLADRLEGVRRNSLVIEVIADTLLRQAIEMRLQVVEVSGLSGSAQTLPMQPNRRSATLWFTGRVAYCLSAVIRFLRSTSQGVSLRTTPTTQNSFGNNPTSARL
jgi:hypothetical protein